eukprot:9616239-Alexandrium_andersonii.AAC.1
MRALSPASSRAASFGPRAPLWKQTASSLRMPSSVAPLLGSLWHPCAATRWLATRDPSAGVASCATVATPRG